nr:MAG TPA: hypothetical protein [Caudoviricetes sp.]
MYNSLMPYTIGILPAFNIQFSMFARMGVVLSAPAGLLSLDIFYFKA